MEVAIKRITRKHFFAIFLGLVWAFSMGGSPYSADEYRDCSVNCESDVRSVEITEDQTFDARAVGSTPADHMSDLESLNFGGSGGVPATPGNTSSYSDAGSANAQPLKNPAPEGATNFGPRFFLLVGLVLIGIRLIIDYRSRKVKDLAPGTH